MVVITPLLLLVSSTICASKSPAYSFSHGEEPSLWEIIASSRRWFKPAPALESARPTSSSSPSTSSTTPKSNYSEAVRKATFAKLRRKDQGYRNSLGKDNSNKTTETRSSIQQPTRRQSAFPSNKVGNHTGPPHDKSHSSSHLNAAAVAPATVVPSSGGAAALAKKRVMIDPSYTLGCTKEGYFPLPKSCFHFLHCRKSKQGSSLIGYRGFVFRCPKGFRFSGIKQGSTRCQPLKSALEAYECGAQNTNGGIFAPLRNVI